MSQPAKIPERSLSRRRACLVVLGVAAAAFVFTTGSFMAPALDNAGSRWGGLVRMVYAPVCHQSPARCLTLGAAPLAVCARCTGLYLGGVIGLVLGAILVAGRGLWPRPRWLAVAVAPTVVDALLPWFGLPQLPNVPRLLLAVPAGAVAASFLALGLTDLTTGTDKSRVSDPRARNVSRVLEETDG